MIVPMAKGHFAKWRAYVWTVYHVREPQKALHGEPSLQACADWVKDGAQSEELKEWHRLDRLRTAAIAKFERANQRRNDEDENRKQLEAKD